MPLPACYSRRVRGCGSRRAAAAETPTTLLQGHAARPGSPSCRGGVAGPAGDAALALGYLVIGKKLCAAGLKDF